MNISTQDKRKPAHLNATFSLDINNHKINSKVTDIKSVKHHNIYSTLWTI